eukprot:g5967.t1
MGNSAPGAGLLRAVEDGNLVAVRKCLGSGGTVNLNESRNKYGKSALEIAVAAGDGELVDCLLAAGANPDVSNSYNNTPLHTAAGSGETIIVDLLLKYKAHPSVVNMDGMSPLDCCLYWERSQPARASKWQQMRCAAILLAYGGYAVKFSPGNPNAAVTAVPVGDGAKLTSGVANTVPVSVDIVPVVNAVPVDFATLLAVPSYYNQPIPGTGVPVVKVEASGAQISTQWTALLNRFSSCTDAETLFTCLQEISAVIQSSLASDGNAADREFLISQKPHFIAIGTYKFTDSPKIWSVQVAQLYSKVCCQFQFQAA